MKITNPALDTFTDELSDDLDALARTTGIAPKGPQPMIHAALAAVMAEVGHVEKSRTNAGQNYKFRGVDDVMAQCQLVLAKHKVHVVPHVEADTIIRNQWTTSKEYQGKSKDTVTFSVSMVVTFTFYAEDGSCVTAAALGEGFDQGDKAGYKAMAGALKYALTQSLCIPTAEAKDPEDDNHEVHPKGAPPQTAQEPRPQAPRAPAPKTLADAAARRPAQPTAPQAPPTAAPKLAVQPRARVEPTAEEIHAPPPSIPGEYPRSIEPNGYGDPMVELYELPVKQARFDSWENWCDERTTVNGKGKLSPFTWRECAEGSDDGMRKNTLSQTVAISVKNMRGPQKERPTKYHEQCAVALWHLLNREANEQLPPPEGEAEYAQVDDTPF